METSGIENEPVSPDIQENAITCKAEDPNVELGVAFKAGDEIMRCDPMVKCLSRELLESRCYHCFKANPIVLCGGCRVPRYCNSGCMLVDYVKAHSFECALWRSTHHFRQYCLDGDDRLLMLRLYASLESDRSMTDALWPSTFGPSRSFAEVLQRREVNMQTMEGMQICHIMAHFIGAIVPTPGPDFWRINLLHCLACLKGIVIPDPTNNTRIGWGIYVIPALLEHDCRPNAVLLPMGSHLAIRAIRDFGVNEMPNISYLRDHNCWGYRAVILKWRYDTRCYCRKCTYRTDGNVDMTLLNRLLEDIVDLWRQPVILQVEWEAACQKHCAIVNMFRQMYEEYDEHITDQYKKMASIGMRAGVKKNNLMPLIEAAAQRMDVTYGPGHFKVRAFDAERNNYCQV